MVAPAEAVASCGPAFDADVHGRVVFVCPDDAGGWSLRLVDAAGAVVRSFDSGDAGPQNAWASAAQHGIVGFVTSPEGNGQLSFADGKTGLIWISSSGSPVGFAYDFEGAFLVVERSATQHTWQRYDDLGNPITQQQSVPGVLFSAAYWASIDVRGNVLAAWQQSGTATQAQWFGQDLAPIGTPFSLGTTSWPEVVTMPGGGFALSASADDLDHWTGVLKPGASAIDPVPALRLDRGTRAYSTVFSGEAYAFADAACPNAIRPCPTASAEIVASEGTSCGVLTLRDPDGSARAFLLTRAGTIIDVLPQGAGARRWWPAVLR